MKRWIVPPLIAAIALCGSGFLDALQRTTDATAQLAAASREGTRTSGQARANLVPLRDVAAITGRQVDAAKTLADALGVSARRVGDLNDRLAAQSEGLRELRASIQSLGGSIDCISRRVQDLAGAARTTPAGLDAVRSTLMHLVATQQGAIRHLRSINRKLTALGVVAAATNVREPPPPPPATAPTPRRAPGPAAC